jgi:hypothetical protein
MTTKKNYYDDPEWKEKHLEYMKTKVQCKCGSITARNNMHHHRRTAKHQKFIEHINDVEKLAKNLTTEQVKKLIKMMEYIK